MNLGGWSGYNCSHSYEHPNDWYLKITNMSSKVIPPGLLHPGGKYRLYVAIPDTWRLMQLGLYDGSSNILGPQHYGPTITEIISLPATASQTSSYLMKCYSQPSYYCYMHVFEAKWLPTYYRAINKTLTDEVTNESYSYQYAYEGAAVNDAGHSGYVYNDPGGAYLMTPPLTEFRGHNHVTETSPDGKVVETWYKQDDIYKGSNYQTLIRNTSANKYVKKIIDYGNNAIATMDLPHPQGQPEDFYRDLKIYWIITRCDENYTYNGDETYIKTWTNYQYNTSEQDGNQYGNLTRSMSYYWNNTGWVAYRGSRTVYYPKVINGDIDTSRYLTGLPGYTNTYQCPGDCDWGDDDLLSSQWYLYDDHTMYSDQPDDGKPTGSRTLVYFDTPPFSDPMYTDIEYGYDEWGNRTNTTQYSGYTDTTSFGLGDNPRTTYICYGTGDAPTCNSDGYNTYPAWETNALVQKTTFTYDKGKGVPTDITGPNGTTTTTHATYDEYGRILTIVRPDDDGTNPTMRMSYHTASAPFLNNPFWTEVQQRITGSTYFKLRKYYNGIGQQIQTQVVGATIGAQTRDLLTDTFYDDGGRVFQQTVPYDVATGSNYHVRNTGAAHTETTYDILGRTVNRLATDSSPTSYIYWDGYINNVPYLSITETNPRGFATTTRNDIWGRTVNVAPPTTPTVDYIYDAADRLMSATRGGATTTIVYDQAGRKTSMDDPDMGGWTYTYDAIGNMKTQTDGRGCTTTLIYDDINRLTGKSYSGNCGVTTTAIAYTYDFGTNGIGRRTGMSDGSGSTNWIYDSRGRLIKETKNITGSGTFVTRWGYNPADQVSWMMYPSNNSSGEGETVYFAYLNQMLLDTVIGTNTYVNNTDYDASGRVDARDMGLSGGNPVIRVDYTYFLWTDVNGQGRLRQITSGVMDELNSLQDLRYTYDANGNVLTIQDYKAGSPQTQTFTYDSLDRLISAVASGGTGGTYTLQSYNYDSTTGNLSSKAGVNYTYGDINHKHAVTQMGSDSFGYDANGNQTNRTVAGSSYTLSYDAENRLVGVSGATSATFVYDGDGNRVKGTIGTTTTTYIGNYFEWAGSTSTMKNYYYAGSTRVAMRTGSSTLNYLLGDHLSSQSITTNSSGTRTAELRYYPWGTERYTYGTTPTTYHFTGQRLESALGLYFYNARWYDPSAGRWIQPDTLIPEQQGVQAWDRFAYTNNNPVKYTDPTGHKMVCDPEDPNCNQEARHDEKNNCVGNNDDNDQILTPPDQSSPTIADSIATTEPEPIVAELTNAQKIGKTLTVIYVDFFILAPIEGLLILTSIELATMGPVGVVGDVILAPIELAIIDLGLSLAVNTYESVESSHNVKFKWILIPAAASVLPQPIQNFLHELIPGVIP